MALRGKMHLFNYLLVNSSETYVNCPSEVNYLPRWQGASIASASRYINQSEMTNLGLQYELRRPCLISDRLQLPHRSRTIWLADICLTIKMRLSIRLSVIYTTVDTVKALEGQAQTQALQKMKHSLLSSRSVIVNFNVRREGSNWENRQTKIDN